MSDLPATHTDQIRNLRNISVRPVRREFVLDNTLYIVEVEAELPNGRKDFATAAVPVKGLTGDALANAIMKCETKAKRRVTLSIAGLGMLDETEIETIPDAQPATGHDVRGYEGTNGEENRTPMASEKQLKTIQVLARKCGMTKDEYRQTLWQAYGVESSRQLTAEQASEFIDYLRSLAEEKSTQTPTPTQTPTEDPTEVIKQQCERLGFSKPESIAVRSAINTSGVDPAVAARALSEVHSKAEAIEGLRMVGVPNPFKTQQVSAAAGSPA